MSDLVAGIDLGLQGAIAVLNRDTRVILYIEDIPIFTRQLRSGKKRRSIDPARVLQEIETLKDLGCVLAVIEEVQSRPGQSGGVTSGYGAGLIIMACYAAGLRNEPVAAATWKARMRAPSDKWGAVQRADQLFPEQGAFFRSVGYSRAEKKTWVDGRAEAAMIALYGIEHILGSKPR